MWSFDLKTNRKYQYQWSSGLHIFSEWWETTGMAHTDRSHCPISFYLSGRQMWGPLLPQGSLCLGQHVLLRPGPLSPWNSDKALDSQRRYREAGRAHSPHTEGRCCLESGTQTPPLTRFAGSWAGLGWAGLRAKERAEGNVLSII